MNLVIAIPFSKRPPAGYCDPLRAMLPGVKIIASQPLESTGVRGPDKLIFHMNVTSEDAQRVADYGNNIFRPLLLEAKTMADAVLYIHENVQVNPDHATRLVTMLERMSTLQFASAAPRVWESGLPDIPNIIDYADRFLVWRSATVERWLAPFDVDPQGRATMDEINDRITAAADGSNFVWCDDMKVIEL